MIVSAPLVVETVVLVLVPVVVETDVPVSVFVVHMVGVAIDAANAVIVLGATVALVIPDGAPGVVVAFTGTASSI